jgi:hypothetical protein
MAPHFQVEFSTISSAIVAKLTIPDLQVDFIQMPRIAHLTTAAFELIGIRLPEFQRPLTDGFIRQDDAALCHKLFNITETEREAKIQSDAVTDNLRREAVASVIGSSGSCFHEAILTQCSATFPG